MVGHPPVKMWRYATTNEAGSSHNKSGLPCQDRFICDTVDGSLVIAVSDGAGSATHSHVGAEIATETAVKTLKQALQTPPSLWSEVLINAAKEARLATLAKANELNLKERDLACTLLLVVATEQGGAALQIGDGVVFYKDFDGWAHVFWPQKGEFANTTFFLTDDKAESRFEVAELTSPFVELVVMTDGLERLALNFKTYSAYAPFLECIFEPLRNVEGIGEDKNVSKALATFLTSSRIVERTDDDLTVCLATRV